MSGNGIPTLHKLQQPEKFQDVLRKDQGEDCLSCKVVGTGAFLGLGAYSYFTGMSQLERQQAKILQSGSMFGMRSRRFGIASISMGLAFMGLWRATH